MDGELLRLIDSLHRDKGIDQEIIFNGIESALASAVRKNYPKSKELQVTIDRTTGQISARDENGPLEPSFLGRIAAQTAKHVIIQKIKEAESDVIFTEMEHKKGDIVTGAVQRMEHGTLIINFSKVEGTMPRNEQIPGESYRNGERIKALVLMIRKEGTHVNVVLSRSHPNFIRHLFEQEVPEIMDKTVEIKALARDAGFRTKIAVISSNPKVDAVGACVGVRGARIKNIMEEVYGEKIDIIKWDEMPENFIKNAMKPAEVEAVEVFPATKKARVYVKPDQLSLAIGKRGQNIRLVCRLTLWDIDVVSTAEPEEPAPETAAEPAPAGVESAPAAEPPAAETATSPEPAAPAEAAPTEPIVTPEKTSEPAP